MFIARTRLFFIAFLKDPAARAGAAIKSTEHQAIRSGSGSGAASKLAAPQHQICYTVPVLRKDLKA